LEEHSDRTAPGASSTVRWGEQWFVACRSAALGKRAVGLTIQGTPLVLFRGEGGRPGALEDRCPHRNAPLSAGRLRSGVLECAYHGWRFDTTGRCLAIPGLAAPPKVTALGAPAYACVEQDGCVWVYSTAGAAPRRGPFRFPCIEERGYSTIHREFEVRSSLQEALENTLDVPHTAFLHGGLFRTDRMEREIEVVVRRYGDRCEAEFIGERRPEGLAGRLLAPGGGVVKHVDRFLLPSIAQVEYQLGEDSHLIVTSAMTPVAPRVTRLTVAVTFRLPLPAWLVRTVLTPIATRVFRQDARMLSLQADNLRRFGGERFANTELDVLGPQIARLLRQAERGEGAPTDGVVHEHRARMRL
jgi:phenylpropionate dioxygenase-like ring-hydroxylating dioxygenase large terminal subunit